MEIAASIRLRSIHASVRKPAATAMAGPKRATAGTWKAKPIFPAVYARMRSPAVIATYSRGLLSIPLDRLRRYA